MSTRVAINGLGRIGRTILKLVIDEASLELVAVNDVADVERLAYLLRFDSVYGRYDKPVLVIEETLVVAGRELRTLRKDNPLALPWNELEVDLVFECTGVDVVAGATVTACRSLGEQCILTLRTNHRGDEREVIADCVVAGIGAQPNVELAQAAGLAVEDGIRVDGSLRTSDPNIYAAGDVASFHDDSLNQWLRIEHADNANTMGGFAGVAMAGRTVWYDHLPFFYSDFFDLGYEAVGLVDSHLQMVIEWTVPCREGVIYYLRDGRVRGVLLWNIWGQADAARRLVASPASLRPKDLKGRFAAGR